MKKIPRKILNQKKEKKEKSRYEENSEPKREYEKNKNEENPEQQKVHKKRKYLEF